MEAVIGGVDGGEEGFVGGREDAGFEAGGRLPGDGAIHEFGAGDEITAAFERVVDFDARRVFQRAEVEVMDHVALHGPGENVIHMKAELDHKAGGFAGVALTDEDVEIVGGAQERVGVEALGEHGAFERNAGDSYVVEGFEEAAQGGNSQRVAAVVGEEDFVAPGVFGGGEGGVGGVGEPGGEAMDIGLTADFGPEGGLRGEIMRESGRFEDCDELVGGRHERFDHSMTLARTW